MRKRYSVWQKEELIKELEKKDKLLKKKYGILWEDKPEKVAELCKEKLPVLQEDTRKEIKTDEKKPVNILIEGDNYHALSVLSYTHKGKIDVIYIDPPYNTGNGDTFKYDDKIVDKEDAYRHSKWLSFMEKRLKLAKNLLTTKGVIFISIDDNEQSQLKLLCDEIFGEKNFLATIVLKNKAGAGAKPKALIEVHEYVLFYAKNSQKIKSISIPHKEKNNKLFTKKDKNFATRGHYGTWALATTSMDDRPNLRYPIKYKGEEIWPEKQWLWSKERVENAIKNDELVFNKMKNGKWSVRFKRYLKDTEGNVRRSTPTTLFEGPYTHEGTRELIEILGNRTFIFPKPVNLIKKLLNFNYNNEKNNDAIILDFFAGSGTTGHAVLDLNKEDKGSRKFILCTNNESNICTEVCYPRVKKVIQNLEKESKSRLVKNMPGNLKYFKTDFVDAQPTDRNKRKLVDKSTEMLCLKEDCFDEIKKEKSFRIFKGEDNKFLGIIYDDDGIKPLKKQIKKMNKKFVVYVFSLDESAREEEFENIADMVDLKPIPAVILNVYKRIFK